MEDLKSKIRKATDEFFDANDTASEPVEAPQEAQPVDYYQMSQNDIYEASQKPTAFGSPAQITKIVDGMVDDTAERFYNAYNDQYQHFMDTNDSADAKRVAQEYMMNHALPMVESLVAEYGADALLNNNKALAKLDSIMLTGNGAGDGYTKGFIKQMHYQTTGTQGTNSDAELSRGLQRAMSMADSGNIRGGVGLARALKEKVDNGELSASGDDYAMLLQAVSYK